MSSDGINTGRRRFLTAATSAVGVAGVVGIAIPFVGSWNPSARAKAAGAPVKADIGKVEPGQMIVVEWRGQPVYVLHRTEVQTEDLAQLDGQLKDPAFDKRLREVGRQVARFAYLHHSEQAQDFLRLWETAPTNPGGD
jgi:ubiquinol-cytochrome c reductase iron-sulfur subunit